MEKRPDDKQAAVDEAIKYACSKMKIKELLPEQDKCVRAFLEGKDVFICLPTGYGKSLCFAILFDYLRGHRDHLSIVICVAPLLSLMEDQYNRFKDYFSVVVVSSSIYQQVSIQEVFDGNAQLIYISPEALLTNEQYREMLQSQIYQDNLVAFIVDEAHTVKRW